MTATQFSQYPSWDVLSNSTVQSTSYRRGSLIAFMLNPSNDGQKVIFTTPASTLRATPRTDLGRLLCVSIFACAVSATGRSMQETSISLQDWTWLSNSTDLHRGQNQIQHRMLKSHLRAARSSTVAKNPTDTHSSNGSNSKQPIIQATPTHSSATKPPSPTRRAMIAAS